MSRVTQFAFSRVYAKASIFWLITKFRTQELGQRGGDRLLRNAHRPLQDQPVCGSRAALQSVSAMLDPVSGTCRKVAACWFNVSCFGPPLPSLRVLLRDFLTAEDKEGVFNADHFPLWYKRAAEQVPGTFVYSVPFSSGRTQLVRPPKSSIAGR